jgi:hypothetical protein
MMLVLAESWRPFVDPLGLWVHDWWFLFLVPVSFLLSVAYRAVREPSIESLSVFFRAVAVMSVKILLGMFGLAAVLYFIVLVFTPMIAG